MPGFHWWRTVFYLIPLVSLYTVALGTVSLLSTLVDRSGNFAHRCARAWATAILKTTGVRVRVEGLEHLAGDRSYVFAANHQSIYDIPIVFASVPMQLRIVAKESLGRIPFLGWHLRRAGHLLVDRRNPGADIVHKMRRLVGESSSLIVRVAGGAREHLGEPLRHEEGTPDGLPGRRPLDDSPSGADGWGRARGCHALRGTDPGRGAGRREMT
jgi:1-acyl-sn-glycerol-3-phosphate acyltransferase